MREMLLQLRRLLLLFLRLAGLLAGWPANCSPPCLPLSAYTLVLTLCPPALLRPALPACRCIMGLILLVVLGIVAIIVLNVLKTKGVVLPGVSVHQGEGGLSSRGGVIGQASRLQALAWLVAVWLAGWLAVACSGRPAALPGTCPAAHRSSRHAPWPPVPPACRTGGGCCGSHLRGRGDAAIWQRRRDPLSSLLLSAITCTC